MNSPADLSACNMPGYGTPAQDDRERTAAWLLEVPIDLLLAEVKRRMVEQGTCTNCDD